MEVSLEEEPPPPCRRVLVVDDDPTSLFVLETILGNEGIEVVTANNGLQAVEATRTQSFDLVLMDLNMPKMNGIDATVAIRALPGGQPPPIIAVTANATSAAFRACTDAGMVDFITKPVDLNKLIAVVSTHIGVLPIQREREGRQR